MTSRYLPFVDWMKACGMALIVWGHVAGGTTLHLTPPFYVKQIGVTFFVFLTGFTLAREERSPLRVVFNRYFDVFAWGLLFATAWSIFALFRWNDANLSNYLPLAGGIELFQDAFPANPTTWYIGTYLHILVFWALVLRHRTITLTTLLTWLPFEVLLRAVLIVECGYYVSYMQLGNWIGVLLLGLWYAERSELPRRSAFAAAAFIIAWPIVIALVGWTTTFPFQSVRGMMPPMSALVSSVCVSVAYLSYTWSGYAIMGHLAEHAFVRFLARNTLIVFIAHMPLYYALEFLLNPRLQPYGVRVTIEFILCYVVLSFASEGLRWAVDLKPVRDRLFSLLTGSSVDEMTAGTA